jgi:hypothetical protein
MLLAIMSRRGREGRCLSISLRLFSSTRGELLTDLEFWERALVIRSRC